MEEITQLSVPEKHLLSDSLPRRKSQGRDIYLSKTSTQSKGKSIKNTIKDIWSLLLMDTFNSPNADRDTPTSTPKGFKVSSMPTLMKDNSTTITIPHIPLDPQGTFICMSIFNDQNMSPSVLAPTLSLIVSILQDLQRAMLILICSLSEII